MGFLEIVSMDENGVTVTPFDQISDQVRMEIQVALMLGDVRVYDPETGRLCE